MAAISLESLDELPPQDLDAERAVLGCLLLDMTQLPRTSLLLRPEEFHNSDYKILFEHLLNYPCPRDGPADMTLVLNCLRDASGLRERNRFAPLIAELYSLHPIVRHLEYYCDIVVEMARLRRLRRAGEELIRRVSEGQTTARVLARETWSKIQDIA